jgi:hypothetical protein
MQINWDSNIDDALKKAIIRFIDERSGHESLLPGRGAGLEIRKAWLPFYPRLGFVELTDHPGAPPSAETVPSLANPNPAESGQPSESDPRNSGSRRLYALLDPDADEVTILDLTNQPVYRLNAAGHLRLATEQEAVGYIAFFFSCVAGPYGLMPVIENLETPDDVAPDSDTQEALNELKGTHIPPKAGREGDNWRVWVALLFQGAVFKAEIVIEQSGLVRVDKHELALAAADPEDLDEEAGEDEAEPAQLAEPN